jgi:N-acetylglutamate synthase
MRLWTEAGLPFRPAGRDQSDRVARELQRGTAIFLLAEEAGRLAGVVIGTNDGRKGWINRLAVAPAYRRRGVATLLVRAVEERLNDIGIDIIAALIESENETSLAFFRSLGYIHDEHIEYVSTRRCADT